jgi:hypothetical protein
MWKQGPQDFTRLNTLGSLIVRLMRIAAFTKISNGQAQLQAHGLTVDLKSAYKEHAQTNTRRLLPQKEKEYELVNMRSTEKSTF